MRELGPVIQVRDGDVLRGPAHKIAWLRVLHSFSPLPQFMLTPFDADLPRFEDGKFVRVCHEPV